MLPVCGSTIDIRVEQRRSACVTADATSSASFDFPVVNKDRAFKCVDAMRPIADRHQVSVAQIALAWLLTRPVSPEADRPCLN
jgi:aryl-alcohol dehydrogenase-like predicted oxidoreductase